MCDLNLVIDSPVSIINPQVQLIVDILSVLIEDCRGTGKEFGLAMLKHHIIKEYGTLNRIDLEKIFVNTDSRFLWEFTSFRDDMLSWNNTPESEERRKYLDEFKTALYVYLKKETEHEWQFKDLDRFMGYQSINNRST